MWLEIASSIQPLLADARDQHRHWHLAFAEARDLGRLREVGGGVVDGMLEVVTRHLYERRTLSSGAVRPSRPREPFNQNGFSWPPTCGMLRGAECDPYQRAAVHPGGRVPQPSAAQARAFVGGFHLGEWTYFVALSIFAFQEAGAAAVGALGLARMVPAAIALPFGGMLADRYARQRVLFAIYAARTLLLVVMAAALAADAGLVIVFALAGLLAVVSAPVPPAVSLVPMLARTPRGSSLRQCLLEHAGGARYPGRPGDRRRPGCHRRRRGGFWRGGSRQRGLRLLVGRIRREGDIRGPRRRVEHSLREELLGACARCAASRAPADRAALQLADDGAGLLNVLLVVASIELLGMGEAGVGWLNAALGAGGLAGGLAAVGLVARRRLAEVFGAGLVLWGAPIAPHRHLAAGGMGSRVSRHRRHRKRAPRRLGLHAAPADGG